MINITQNVLLGKTPKSFSNPVNFQMNLKTCIQVFSSFLLISVSCVGELTTFSGATYREIHVYELFLFCLSVVLIENLVYTFINIIYIM